MNSILLLQIFIGYTFNKTLLITYRFNELFSNQIYKLTSTIRNKIKIRYDCIYLLSFEYEIYQNTIIHASIVKYK